MHIARSTLNQLNEYKVPHIVRTTGVRPYADVPRRHRVAKRTLDVIASSIALLILVPLIPLAWLIIRVSSPGPFLFKQLRVGMNRRRGDDRRKSAAEMLGDDRRDVPPHTHRSRQRSVDMYGAPFIIYKLRSMKEDAEKDGASWAVEDDERVTRVGRILRKYRLDELPQFWNVLKGEMSLVGPRPEQAPIIDQLMATHFPQYNQRLLFKPGITGLAQITTGYDTGSIAVSKKLQQDLRYIAKFSFWFDLEILARTLNVVIRGKGAL